MSTENPFATRHTASTLAGLHRPGQDVNVELLRKGVEWAEAEAAKPEPDRQWVQRTWRLESETLSCGTAYCVAGYIGQLLDPAYEASEWGSGGDKHVSHFATEQLGLTDRQADALFQATNTAGDVRAVAEAIVGGAL